MTTRHTAQTYYDLLVATSAAGRFPSTAAADEPGACRYRGAAGRACAVGVVIPDDVYYEYTDRKGIWTGNRLEGLYVYQLPADLLAAITPDGMTAADLRHCQTAHDSMALDIVRGERPAWDHDVFTAGLDRMPCFAGCNKTAPETQQEAA